MKKNCDVNFKIAVRGITILGEVKFIHFFFLSSTQIFSFCRRSEKISDINFNENSQNFTAVKGSEFFFVVYFRSGIKVFVKFRLGSI